MQALEELYQQGVDFIDIYGVMKEGQDTIGIDFCKEYMDEECVEYYEDIKEEQFSSKVEIKLSDEDLNQLI